MTKQTPGTGTSVAHTARKRWPEVTFTLLYDTYDGHDQIIWQDGPTLDEFRAAVPTATRHVLSPDGRSYHTLDVVTLERNPSFLAWALLRGPNIPPSNELPWDLTALYYDRLEQGEDPQHIYATHRRLARTNLENLHTLTDNTALYAQAETAAAFATDATLPNLETYDIWLIHGGWHMSGQALTH